MTENDFFANLEMRVCREFSGMRDRALRGYWCDGFIPEDFAVVGDCCCITGRVWIAHGKNQDPWNFTLLLGNAKLTREKVDWETIMPGEDLTGWLSMDFKSRVMKIDPFSCKIDESFPRQSKL
jgi:hypothetical protein